MFRKIFFIIISCLSIINLINCGGGSRNKSPVVSYPSPVNSEIKLIFNEAESFYKKRNFDEAIISYNQLINQYPQTKLTDESYYKLGKIYFIKKDYILSKYNFSNLYKQSPDPEYKAKGALMASYSEYKLEDYDQAWDDLDKVSTQDLPTNLKLRYYSLRAIIGKTQGRSDDELIFYQARLLDIYESSSNIKLKKINTIDFIPYEEAKKNLENWVFTPSTIEDIPDWIDRYPETFSKPYLVYKEAKTYIDNDDLENGLFKMSMFVSKYPRHEYASDASEFIEEEGDDEMGDVLIKGHGLKVGVILPLSGKRGTLGKNILESIQCGAGLIGQCLESFISVYNGLSVINVVTVDEADKSTSMEEKINFLAKAGVHAIIGPLDSDSTELAAKFAAQRKLLLFSFTQKHLEDTPNYFFQMSYPVHKQIDDLVKILKRRRIKRIGVFYPDHEFGNDLTNALIEKAAEKKITVEARASYNPQKFDLIDEARDLKLSVSNFSFESKNIGFDALFIPDAYWKLNRLIPALNFVDINGIPLFGPSSWNDSKLSKDFKTYFPKSFFVDLYYPDNPKLINETYSNSLYKSFNRRPSSLEALAFDSIWFLRQALKKADIAETKQLRNALKSISRLNGVTNIVSFDQDGVPEIDHYILTSGETGVEISRD